MLYVSRNDAGAVNGIFAAPQHPEQESLAEDDKDVIAFEELLKRQAMPAISHRQFYQALAIKGLISQDEALAAVQHGTIPAILAEYLSHLTDQKEHFAALMLLSGANEFNRSHPLVDHFATDAGMSPAEIDDLWREAASL